MKNSSKYILIAGGIALGTLGGITIGVSGADEFQEVARAPQDFIHKVAGNDAKKTIIPMNKIINQYEVNGNRITDIELDRELFRNVYELELIDANGQGWDIDVDAHSGEELSKHKDWDD
ncbi:MAG: hypothetical protein DHS20C09_13030 [marine bacterium B5-7]|nr:MAG: hypothetical protein DHS20C09_13030 [marine bacterium B5-7]